MQVDSPAAQIDFSAFPDATGHFGDYGGTFVAETLIAALDELKAAYAKYRADPEFLREYEYDLKHFVGRPSPIYHCARLSRRSAERPAWIEVVRPTDQRGLSMIRTVWSAGTATLTSSGAAHERTIALHDDRLVVTDRVRGFERRAVCRWRLRPGAWVLRGNRLTDGRHDLSVEADAPIARLALVEGWESRHYQQRTVVPVLEVEITTPTTLRTFYRWAP